MYQLDETFIDSKYPGVVKLCQYLTKSHFMRIPYYDEIHYSGKNHHDENNVYFIRLVSLMGFMTSMKFII